jgi:outer membrane receptor protein involved in Fe transport
VLKIRRDRYNQEGNQFPTGPFGFSGQATQNPQSISNTGNGVADFLLGLVRTSAGAVVPLAVAQLRATAQYYYVDDSWKVRPNLTLTMGLRYEFAPPYTAKHDELINT